MVLGFHDRSQLGTQPGCTIGQAVRQARRHVRDAAPHDPTWLADSLYAHPNAHVRLGAVARYDPESGPGVRGLSVFSSKSHRESHSGMGDRLAPFEK